MPAFFSIITAIYNKSDCIAQTVTSLTSQTFSNIEIILVDDHSTDDTFSKIKNFAKQDARIKAIQHKKNLGVHQARTTGVAMATGKYIMFLDGDDYLDLNACKTIHDTTLQQKADVYEFSYYKLPEKKICRIVPEKRDRVAALLSEENSYPATIWNKAYKTSIVKKAFNNTPFIPQNGPEDLFEAVMMAFYSSSYTSIDEPLYCYNTGSGISTRKRTFHDNEVYFSNMKLVVDLTKEFFNKKKSDYAAYIPQLERRLLRDSIWWFISNLTIKEDVNKSYIILPRYFSEESIEPYFSKVLLDANNYKNGKLNLLAFIKYFFKKLLKKI